MSMSLGNAYHFLKASQATAGGDCKQLLSERQLQMSAADCGEQPGALSETGHGKRALFQRTSST